MDDRPSSLHALDALSGVLHDFRFSGVNYGRCEMRRPWGLTFDAEGTARLHLVVQGEAWLRTAQGECKQLNEGDVVLLPRGPGHVLSDRPGTIPKPLSHFVGKEIGDRVVEVEIEGSGRRTIMSCCSVSYEGFAVRSLVALMPDNIVIRRVERSDPLLETLLDAMADEVKTRRMGYATMLSRLADLAISSIIRRWVERAAKAPDGWLAALSDPNLGRVIKAIHDRPGEAWTADSLAREAAMSRSAFYARFTSLTGQTPSRYLASVRMATAKTLLRERGTNIAMAASRLGYESEAAFSRAFKRVEGYSPSATFSRVAKGRVRIDNAAIAPARSDDG